MVFAQWVLHFLALLRLGLVKPEQKVVVMCGDGGFLMKSARNKVSSSSKIAYHNSYLV